jgi:hypothetical protein
MDVPIKEQNRVGKMAMEAKSWSERVDSRLKQNKPLLYVSSFFMGVARTLIGFPFEHPLDSIKTQWQAIPEAVNEWDIIKRIYTTKGFKGFFAGGLANATRGVVKNAYRFPALIIFPRLNAMFLPKRVVADEKLMRGMTALTISLSEVVILNPFERLKVVSMTKSGQLTYRQFLHSVRTGLTKELNRGLTPYFTRQLVSWFVFLEADVILKQRARQLLHLKPDQQIPMKPLFATSLAVGLVTTFVYMPLDMIKTHMQMFKPRSSMASAYHELISQHGVRGLFTGWRVKTLQYMVATIFAVVILEKLEYWAK